MKRSVAVDRLLLEYRAGEEWRGYFENIVYRLTDGADSLDMETFNQIREYLRKIT